MKSFHSQMFLSSIILGISGCISPLQTCILSHTFFIFPECSGALAAHCNFPPSSLSADRFQAALPSRSVPLRSHSSSPLAVAKLREHLSGSPSLPVSPWVSFFPSAPSPSPSFCLVRALKPDCTCFSDSLPCCHLKGAHDQSRGSGVTV